jgi:hypothetical protein
MFGLFIPDFKSLAFSYNTRNNGLNIRLFLHVFLFPKIDSYSIEQCDITLFCLYVIFTVRKCYSFADSEDEYKRIGFFKATLDKFGLFG